MTRFTLLLFLILPFISFSQNNDQLKNQSSTDDQISSGLASDVTSKKYATEKSKLIGRDLRELIELGYINEESLSSSAPTGSIYNGDDRSEPCMDAYIPKDDTYTEVPRNDDGFLYIPDIGFIFSFCGTTYTDLFINTNGNLSFGDPVSQYSPDGFPYDFPMVAPFWGDVDTENDACGQAWYKLFANYMIVTWEEVGWYQNQCNPLNTFQVIISDGTAAIIGVGNNIQFRYGDMNWTTGQASGGGPFGGSPATVGYNSGDNVNFEQIGRFNVDSYDYDGPYGNNDGVHWLDYKCFSFNSAGGSILELNCNDIVRSLDGNCSLTITPEEVGHANVDGCSTIDLSLDISSFNCENEGENTVTLTATSGQESISCTAIVTITTENCPIISIDQIGPFCEDDPVVTLNGTPSGGTWGGAAVNGTFDPNSVGPGIHTITYLNVNSCPTMDTIEVEVFASPDVSISPDPTEFCEDEGSILLTATGSGGDGNLTYSWLTPGPNGNETTYDATLAGSYTVITTDGNGCSAEDETLVLVYPNPIVVIVDPGPICENVDLYTLTAAPSGGTWDGQIISPSGDIYPAQTGPGIYSVSYSYTNSFGCASIDYIDIEITAMPFAFPSNDGPYCEGDPIFLYGDTNGNGSVIEYSWTGPDNYSSNDQNPTDATVGGMYILQVSVDGCPSGFEVTQVIVTETPEAIALNDSPFCEGATIELFGSTLNNGNNISYEWSGPNNYFSFDQNPTNATEAGIYSLIVSVDGCLSDPDDTEVIISPAPDAIAENDGPYCTGDAILLTGSTNASGTIIIYNWSGPNNYNSNDQNPLDATEPGTYYLTVEVDGCGSDSTNTIVVFNNLPQPTISGSSTFCENGSSTLDAGVYASYLWSDTSINQTLEVTVEGTYYVTVTDANGCTGEDDFTVIQTESLNPIIIGDLDICDGQNSVLDAGVGYATYLWSNSDTTQTIDVSDAEDYSVTVSDNSGCTGETTVTLIVNNNPTVNITGDDSFCDGESSILDGGLFSSYLWSDSSTNPTLEVFDSGIYSVQVTDANGCTAEDDFEVTETANPTPVITGPSSFCTGNTATLDGGPGYETYLWSDATSNQTVTISTGGIVGLTVTDSNGCTGETEFDITENASLTPLITGDFEICDGQNSILDAGSGYATYLWSNSDTTQTIDVSDADDYSVTVSDNSGCTGETSASLTVNNNPSVTIQGVDSFCDGESSILEGGIFSSYLWSDSSTNPTLEVFDSGTYSLEVTDANGCTAEDDIIITENQNPIPVISGPSSFCSGNTATLDGGPGYETYLWSDGSGEQTITVSIGGLVGLTVTDSNGCIGETEIDVIENESLTPEITGDLEFCSGIVSMLDAGAGYETYEWSNGDSTQTIEVTTTVNIGVVVTDLAGCSGSDNVSTTVFSNPDPVIGGSTTYCVGGFTILNAGAGFDSYVWSNNELTQSITVSSPGNYSVEVEDQNGCTGTAFVDITESTSLNPVISGLPAFCESDFTVLNAGSGFDTYLWSDNSNGPTLQVDVEGNYSITVSDGQGCTGETSVSVVEVPPPFAILQSDTSVCNTEAGGSFLNLYDLIQSGDTNGNWEDVDNSGAVGLFSDLNFDGIPAGDYNFIYTTSSAVAPCPESSYQISVTIIDCSCPDVAFLNTDPLCNGGEILDLSTIENTLEDGSWSIIQTPPGGSPATVNGVDFDATDADPGEYVLQFQLTNQPPPGCTDLYLMSVMVENGVDAGTAMQPTSFCFNEAENISLDNLIAGGDLGGTWTETSSIPSSGNAFDALSGTFLTDGQIPGNYTFQYTVTSFGACPDDFEEVIVIINELPNAIAGDAVLLNCYNPVLNLDATASSTGVEYVYEWIGPGVVIDGNENSLTPTVDQPGFYNLTITNSLSGCIATDLVEVTDNFIQPQVIAGTDENLTCDSPSVNLESQGDIGSGFEITWDGPGINAGNINDPNPEVNVPGIYTITVLDLANGCVSLEDAVEVFDQFDIPDVFIQTPLEELDCNTSSLALTGGSINNASFEWSFNNVVIGTNEILDNVTEPGTYSFTVTDNITGCTATDSVEVLDNSVYPNAEGGLAQLLNCYETQVTLDGSGSDSGPDIVYQWNGPAGGILGSNTENSITAILPGTYTIFVENESNGCVSFDEVIVNQDIIAPDAIIADTDELDCTVTEVSLDGSLSSGGSNISYAWTDNAGNPISTNQSIIVDNPGNYNLFVLNTDNGCSDIASVDVVENENVPYATIMNIENPPCFGDNNGFIAIQQVLGGSAPYVYSLNNETFSSVNFYNNLSPGTYDLALEDANGCTWDTTIVIVEPVEVDLDLGPDIEVEFGEYANVTALINIPQNRIDTILWTPNDLVICTEQICIEGSVYTFNTTLISATVIDENGCRDSDEVMIVVNKDRRVYIPTAFSPNSDGSNDMFYIYVDASQVTKINQFSVFNRWGEVMFEASNFEPNDPLVGWDGKFNNESLNPSVFVYFAEVEFIDGHVEMYKGDVTLLK